MKYYHKFEFYEEEEAYLNRMSKKGYQFINLDEGYYEFEKRPEQNYYRMAYVYNMDEKQFDSWKIELKEDEIEFMFKKGIWAFFRSNHPFHLYTVRQKREIRKKLVSSYKKTGYAFLLGSILFALAAKYVGRGLYVMVILFFLIGFIYIYQAVNYEYRGDKRE